MHTREKLTGDIRMLGIDPGDTVMLHASIRSVGEVAGGPDQIHLALKDALTPQGTLLMYAVVRSITTKSGPESSRRSMSGKFLRSYLHSIH
jgi:aminoglycoside N3'-acetyltransferase